MKLFEKEIASGVEQFKKDNLQVLDAKLTHGMSTVEKTLYQHFRKKYPKVPPLKLRKLALSKANEPKRKAKAKAELKGLDRQQLDAKNHTRNEFDSKSNILNA